MQEGFQTGGPVTCELLTSCACCSASWIFTDHLIPLGNTNQITLSALCHGRHGAAHPADTKCFGSSVAGKNLKCMNIVFICLQEQNRAQPLSIFYLKNAFHPLALLGVFLNFFFWEGVGVLFFFRLDVEFCRSRWKEILPSRARVILRGQGTDDARWQKFCFLKRVKSRLGAPSETAELCNSCKHRQPS